VIRGGFARKLGPGHGSALQRLALAAIAYSVCAPLSTARADARNQVSSADCLSEQADMRAQGWAPAEIQRQLNEPNGVSADQFVEYLEAFRAGLKVSRQENDLESMASYRLGVCAFETASLRSKLGSQPTPAGAALQGERVYPKTSAPSPVTTGTGAPRNTGFVAPRQSAGVQPLAPAASKPAARTPSSSHVSIVAGPQLTMNGAPLITPEDYPLSSLRLEEHGVVGFSVTVSANGLPTGCSITSSSGFPSLDGQTCALVMERSRFSPAKTASGRAAPATYQQQVRWTLPE
jgi:TonB family protein